MWLVFVGLFLLALSLTLILGILIQSSTPNFRNEVYYPGDQYFIYDRAHVLPVLGDPKQPFRILNEPYLNEQLLLLGAATRCLRGVEVPVWLAGTTLLGAVRHGTVVPWSTDNFVHAKIESLSQLMGAKFKRLLQENHLTFTVETHGYGSSQMACGHIKFEGHRRPTLRIFFVMADEEEVRKIDGWTEINKDADFELSEVETWSPSTIFPLKHMVMDDIKVSIPHRPELVLKRQFGPHVLKQMTPHLSWLDRWWRTPKSETKINKTKRKT